MLKFSIKLLYLDYFVWGKKRRSEDTKGYIVIDINNKKIFINSHKKHIFLQIAYNYVFDNW